MGPRRTKCEIADVRRDVGFTSAREEGSPQKSNGINGAVDAGNSVRFADPVDAPASARAVRLPALLDSKMD